MGLRKLKAGLACSREASPVRKLLPLRATNCNGGVAWGGVRGVGCVGGVGWGAWVLHVRRQAPCCCCRRSPAPAAVVQASPARQSNLRRELDCVQVERRQALRDVHSVLLVLRDKAWEDAVGGDVISLLPGCSRKGSSSLVMPRVRASPCQPARPHQRGRRINLMPVCWSCRQKARIATSTLPHLWRLHRLGGRQLGLVNGRRCRRRRGRRRRLGCRGGAVALALVGRGKVSNLGWEGGRQQAEWESSRDGLACSGGMQQQLRGSPPGLPASPPSLIEAATYSARCCCCR